MSEKSDQHEKRMSLWRQYGRDKIPVIPQYERASFGFCPSQVKRYAFKDQGDE